MAKKSPYSKRTVAPKGQALPVKKVPTEMKTKTNTTSSTSKNNDSSKNKK